MSNVKFYSGESVPLEMHKAKIVQKVDLVPIERRLEAIKEAGNNTFLLKNRDVYGSLSALRRKKRWRGCFLLDKE